MNVSVDKDFARFGAKSYAINKINTVEVREVKPYGSGLAVILALITLGLALTAFNQPLSSAFGYIIAAVIFGALAYAAYKRAQTVDYQLFLMTSSSEAQAFTTRNRDEVDNLRDAIENAMMGRPLRDASEG